MLLQLVEPGQTPLPHEKNEEVAIGIDLGTTNSVVAVSIQGKVTVLEDENGTLVPSVVDYAEDKPIVGHQAFLKQGQKDVVSSVKRLMGRAADEIDPLLYPLENTSSKGMVRLLIKEGVRTPVEISADILRTLKAKAEEFLKHPVTKAVITVPAYFDEGARQATKDAAQLAGLEVLRLINEPTAAALAYGLDEKAEGIYVVYDLGGGTFDVSILKLTQGVFQVLATGGDTHLGGDDIDKVIAHYLLIKQGEDLPLSLTDLLPLARRIKEYLTSYEEGTWTLPGATEPFAFDRRHLENLIQPVVTTTLDITRKALLDADLSLEELSGVILVGGSTRIPNIRKSVQDYLECASFTHVDPDLVVAFGAALQAEALTKGSETLLLDVAPLSLGVETMGGLVEKIIPRNTPIPARMTQEFTTYQEGQTAMKIHVVQGEREMVDHCRSLGQFSLKGIPPMTAGAARIEVSFTLDADGLLSVKAQEKTTGISQSIEVKPTYGLSEEEMRRMLMESAAQGQADMHQRLLKEAKLEAEQLMAALEQAMKVDGGLIDSDERRQLTAGIQSLKVLLETQDREKIAEATHTLSEMTIPFAEKRMERAIRENLRGKGVEQVS